MASKTITIGIPSGLEARPVAMLVQLASRFESSIYLENNSKKVNAKSIMGMMTLCLNTGEQVTVIATGLDEEKAVQDIERYLVNSN